MKTLKRVAFLVMLLAAFACLFAVTVGAETTTEVGTAADLKTAVSASGTGDVVKLTADITLTEQLVIARDVTIDGGGQYKITGSIGKAEATCMIVAGDASQTGTLKIAFRSISLESTTGYVMTTAGKTELTLESGTTVTLSNQAKTGAIYLLYNTNGCTTTIKNGASVALTVNLTNDDTNKAKVAISNKGVMHVYGSVTVGNLAEGAVYMQGINNAQNTGELYVYEGAYIANTAPVTTDKSCAVWCHGNLTMTGGTLTSCANEGTLVPTQDTSVITITGGTIINTWQKRELSEATQTYIDSDADEYLYAAIGFGNGTGRNPTVTIGGNAVVEATGDGVAIHLYRNGPVLTLQGNAVIRAVGTAIASGDAAQASSDTRANLYLNGGTITADICVHLACKLTLELNGATLNFVTYGVYVNDEKTGTQTHNVTMTAGTIRQNAETVDSGSTGIFVRLGYCTLTISGGEIVSDRHAVRLVSSTNANAQLTLLISGGTLIGKTGYALHLPADEKDSLTITGGSFIGGYEMDATVEFCGRADNVNPVLNIYGGYFEGHQMSAIRAYRNGTLNIYGGHFVFDPYLTSNYQRNVVRAGTGTYASGTVNIYGGYYEHTAIDNKNSTTDMGSVFRVPLDGPAINLYAFSCKGGSTILMNLSAKGTPSLDYPAGGVREFTMNLPEMTDGASVRLVEGSNGLRFQTFLSAEALAVLQAIADQSSAFTYGTIILPLSYLEDLHCFTLEQLLANQVKHLNLVAANGLTESEAGITFRAAIVNIKEKNVGVAFAAIGYVSYVVDGNTVYNYTIFSEADNARSIRELSRMALEDVKTKQTTTYRYETADGTFSRYTPAQRAALTAYYNDGQKVIDLYLIAGQSNAGGHSAYTDAFLASNEKFTQGYENILYYGTAGSVASPYTTLVKNSVTSPETVKMGFGKGEGYFGPEVGLAEALSAYYNTDTDRVAGIIKYAVGGTTLRDSLSNQCKPAGNWTPPSWLAEYGRTGELSGGLYRNFMAEVSAGVEAYRALGYEVNIVGIYWMQGEGDSQQANILDIYPTLLQMLIKDMRRDIGAIMGGNYSDLPFVIGEISGTYHLLHKECFTDFIAMQNRVAAEMNEVYVNHSGVFGVGTDASDTSHWTAEDCVAVGKLLGTLFADIRFGTGVTVPVAEDPVAAVYSAKGELLGEYDSLSYAINTAPRGARVVLLQDIVLYANLNINNANAITIAGNGYRIDSYSVTHGVRLVGCNVTFEEFHLYHHTEGDSAYGMYCYQDATMVFRSGSVNAYRVGIVVNISSNVTIWGGTFTTRHSTNVTSSPLLVSMGGSTTVNPTQTNNSTVVVNGGTFIAAPGAAAIGVSDISGNNSKVVVNGAIVYTDGTVEKPIYRAAGNGDSTLTLGNGGHGIVYKTY